MYRSLDSAKIIETARLLASRVGERFPGSGLGKLSEEILAEARLAATRREIAATANMDLASAAAGMTAAASCCAAIWPRSSWPPA